MAGLCAEVPHVDSFGSQAAFGGYTKGIVPVRANERNFRPSPRGSDRLVGPFAAGELSEFAAEDGFARLRQVGSLDDEIGIGTPDDADAHGRRKARRSSAGEKSSSEVLFVRRAMD